MARPHPRLRGTLFASKIAVGCTLASLNDILCTARRAQDHNTIKNLRVAAPSRRNYAHISLQSGATRRISSLSQRMNAQTK
jgi:hypothetical protein